MKILIADGSKILREKLIRYLKLENYFDDVLEANTVKEAKLIMQKQRIDVVLFDIQLPDKSGLELVSLGNRLFHKPLMIVCSNYALPQYKNTYENLAVHYFFDKSSELVQLNTFIRELVKEQKENSKFLLGKLN